MVVTIMVIRYAKKAGTAKTAVNKRNERSLKDKAKGPWANDVPAKILLFQFSTIGTAARPKVQTTIIAAFCLCFSCSYRVMEYMFWVKKENFVENAVQARSIRYFYTAVYTCLNQAFRKGVDISFGIEEIL